MNNNGDQQQSAATGPGDHPVQRGSAAMVLAGPPTDVAMSAAQTAVPAPAATESKKQKTDEVTLQTLDIAALPDGFKAGVTCAADGLALTQDVRSVEALVIKHHQAVILYRDLLIKQEARLAGLESALPAAQTNSSNAGQLASMASKTADAAGLRAEACDGRVNTPTEELNTFAERLNLAKAEQEKTLSQHLQTIESTFKQCDAILHDVKASMSAAGAAPTMLAGSVLDAPHQELAALRSHVDALAAVIQVTGTQAKYAEDATILHRVQVNELTAWCNNSSKLQAEAMATHDCKLRAELKTEFSGVMEEFKLVKEGLCRCPQGCPGKSGTATPPPHQSQGAEHYTVHSGLQGLLEGEATPAARRPFLNRGLWAGTGGGGGPGGGDDGPGDDDDDGDDGFDDDDSRRPRRGRQSDQSQRPLTREPKDSFDCKGKEDVDKYNGKDNKLWRKKTTNFLASRLPDVHPLLL